MPYNKKVARERGPSPFTLALRELGYTLERFAELCDKADKGSDELYYNHIVNVSRGRSRVAPVVREQFEKLAKYPVADVVEEWQMEPYVRKSTGSPGARRTRRT